MMINMDETIQEMITYFEECAKNAGKNSNAEKRFARYVLVLNLLMGTEEQHD